MVGQVTVRRQHFELGIEGEEGLKNYTENKTVTVSMA
jgi:hypothetical protein